MIVTGDTILSTSDEKMQERLDEQKILYTSNNFRYVVPIYLIMHILV